MSVITQLTVGEHTLINVPAELSTLLELGVEADQAAGLIAEAEQAAQMQRLRQQRNQMLAASDWTQMPDTPLDAESKQAWADYRQALRDITDSMSDTDGVTWPAVPNA